MGKWIDELKASFEQIDQKKLLKTNPSREVALELLAKLETEYDRVNGELAAEKNRHQETTQKDQKNLKLWEQAYHQKCNEIKIASEQITILDKANENIKQQGNQERKSAVARANRFKARYDQLLNILDALLPGAKELLVLRIPVGTNTKSGTDSNSDFGVIRTVIPLRYEH